MLMNIIKLIETVFFLKKNLSSLSEDHLAFIIFMFH